MAIATIGPSPWNLMRQTEYERAIILMCREQFGGGWPPRDVGKVAGWQTVRLLAALFEKRPREVAIDLIQYDRHKNRRQQWP